MLGNLTGNNNGGNEIKATTESTIKKLIKNLEEHVDRLNSDVEALHESFNTSDLNADHVNSISVDTNTVSASSGTIDHLNTIQVLANKVQALTAEFTDLSTNNIEAETLTGQLRSIQEMLRAIAMEATRINATNIITQSLHADAIISTALTMQTIVVQDIGANTANVDYGRIKELESEKVTSAEGDIAHLTSENAEIENLDVNSVVAKTVGASKIVSGHSYSSNAESPVKTGKQKINLDPLLNTDDSYYLITIKKGFSHFSLSVEDSFDITLTAAWIKNADVAKNGSTVALIHQKELNQVVSISDDADFIYIQVSPNNTNELFYEYSGREVIEDVIKVENNGTYEPEYFYKPSRCAEALMLANTPEGDGASDYRMTVLGEFKASVMLQEGTQELQDVAILNSLYVKDYFNEDSGRWTYTHGNKDDYLSRFTDDREMAWRPGVDVEDDKSIKLVDDYTEEVYDDEGNLLGIRYVPGTRGALLAAKAIENWNGKVGTDNIIPYKQETYIFRPRYSSGVESKGFINHCKGSWNIADENNVMLGDLAIPGDIIERGVTLSIHPERSDFLIVTYPDGDTKIVNIKPDYSNEYEVVATYYKQETLNPLTKLGEVTEGEWNAGFVHTEELAIKNPIKWSNDTETEQKEYQIWLNGEEPTEDDLDWIRQ